MWGSMALTICLIVAFFNNKFTIKIFRKVQNFLITDCINVFCIRICFPFSLHIIKLLFVIKVSRHHINKIIELHHAFYLQIPIALQIVFFILSQHLLFRHQSFEPSIHNNDELVGTLPFLQQTFKNYITKGMSDFCFLHQTGIWLYQILQI